MGSLVFERPRASALQNVLSSLQEYASLFPHPTANTLTRKASSLPTTKTRPMPCSIARASFNRIRNTVSVIRPLRTLSTHRMVRSNRPLSTRSSTLNQTRFLIARFFNRARFRPVSGEVRNPCRFESSLNEREISLSLDNLP